MGWWMWVWLLIHLAGGVPTGLGADGAGQPEGRPSQGVTAADIPPYIDINHITPAQWAGAVSAAKEGMRLVYGPMTEAQELKFDTEWLPAFEFPSQEVVEYFNKLNPLLACWLSTRDALAQATQAFDAAQFDALTSAGAGDPDSVEEAMEAAVLQGALVRSLQQRLEQVTQEILAMGPPPNAAHLRRKRKEAHEAAFESLKSPSLLTIVPEDLAATPGVLYEFAVRLGNMPRDAKLELMWIFSDGFSKRTGVDERVKHKFYGDPKNPGQSIRVQLIDAQNKTVLTTATTKVTLAFPKGMWVLVDRQVISSDPGKKGGRFMGGRRNPQTGQMEPIPQLPEHIFDNDIELKENSARALYGNLTRKLTLEMAQSWSKPPPRLAPEDMMQVEGAVQFVNGTYTPAYCYAQLYIGCEFYPWGPGTRTNQMSLGGEMVRANGPSEQKERQLKDAKTARFKMPRPYIRGPKGESIKPDGQYLILELSGSASLGSNTGGGAKFRVQYRYQWDPTGASLKAWGTPDEAGARPDTPSQEPPDAREARLKRERIEFHQLNIEHFRRNIQALETGLYGVTDPDRREAMLRDLLYNRDAMQRELDQIAAIQTGQFVRTRTELDALNLEIMARQGREMARKWDDIARILERGPRLINSAPPADRDRLREYFHRHINSDTIARGDVEKMRRVAASIGEQIIGHYEKEAAVAEEQAIDAATRLAYVENVKGVCDTSMMLLSFGGGRAAYMTYQGVTGFVEGGLGQAFQQTAGAYNTATIIANEAINGYQRGVLEHLDRYAADPQNVKLDEARFGFEGAAWSAGKAAVMAAVMNLGMKAITAHMQSPQNLRQPRQKWPTVQQQLAEARFLSRQANGRVLVKVYQQRCARLAAAGKSGAPRAEIQQLRASAEDAYKAIKVDYHAKAHLNAIGRAGDLKTLHYYNSMDRKFVNQVRGQLEKNMADKGWSRQQYKTFSNSASKGKAGMDLDMGAVEPPRYVVNKEGTRVFNPEYAKWQRGVTQNTPQGPVRKGVHEMQEAGQHELERAFEQVYGRRPGEAMANFTTASAHPEAYRDLAWLGRKGTKTADFPNIDRNWSGQAGDVTNFKINNLPREHPGLGKYTILQEQCRGAVKDFDTKIGPLLKGRSNPQAQDHLRRLRNVMDDFAQNRIGPIEAERQLNLLTGGEGIHEVGERFRIAITHLPRIGANP